MSILIFLRSRDFDIAKRDSRRMRLYQELLEVFRNDEIAHCFEQRIAKPYIEFIIEFHKPRRPGL